MYAANWVTAVDMLSICRLRATALHHLKYFLIESCIYVFINFGDMEAICFCIESDISTYGGSVDIFDILSSEKKMSRKSCIERKTRSISNPHYRTAHSMIQH